MRPRNEANRISFASIELPFFRIEKGQQSVLSAYEGDSKLAGGAAHGAAFQFVRFVSRCDRPWTYGDRLLVSRLSEHRRGEKSHEKEGKWHSHCCLPDARLQRAYCFRFGLSIFGGGGSYV